MEEKYYIGLVFEGIYPEDVPIWCENNKATITINKDGKFEIIKDEEKPTEEKVKMVCELYYREYVSPYASDIFKYNDLSEDDKKSIADYRKYLIDYEKKKPTVNPLDYDSWKKEHTK